LNLASVFTEDVTIDYRGGGYRAKLQGRQNMVDFIGSAFNSDIVAQHHGHCPEIGFTGPDSAEGTWYLEDRFIDPIRQEDTIGTAIYRDRYARTADGWKIAHSEYDRVYEIARPIPADERLSFHLLAKTGRKPEARIGHNQMAGMVLRGTRPLFYTISKASKSGFAMASAKAS
jgi:hypothetical protein